ncbi:MAG: chitobiase/beta-hexosaminidase C-terminal domain-containing protein [Lachnospiraceae bacterium]|jgi:hypothetical protein|nr:chitobiase/beta-hexosaminidase C-terminal domain-containing protein [Lachnospiraceae bacterium]
MKCIKCGFELIDERLICEKCGEEVQIVPDFEPEIEMSISEALSTVVNGIIPLSDEEAAPTPQTEEKAFFWFLTDKAWWRKWRFWLIAGVVIAVSVPLVSYFGISYYRNNSAAYQIEQARIMATNGDYHGAYQAMMRADTLRPNDAAIRIVWAQYAHQSGETDVAVAILLPMTMSSYFSWAEQDESFALIVSFWEEVGRYQDINSLLLANTDEDRSSLFSHFLAPPPIFNVESGVYYDSLILQLSASCEGAERGRIRYSLDGSEPNTESNVYTAPINLSLGGHHVAAVFENEFGILSEVISHFFFVDASMTPPPEITLASGLYVEPTRVAVVAIEGSEVFFTSDGTVPTVASRRYTAPFMIPLGQTEFNFIAFSEVGGASEVVTRVFEYRLISDITPEMAAENVLEAHIRNGKIADISGKATNEEGYFSYNTDALIGIEGKGPFFMVYEYYQSGDEEPQRTGHIFAADAITGAAAHLVHNEHGVLDAIML